MVTIGCDEAVLSAAQRVIEILEKSDIDVLWDDRDVRPGEKFADSDLIGLPHRIVISPKTVEAGIIEYKARNQSESKLIDLEQLIDILK